MRVPGARQPGEMPRFLANRRGYAGWWVVGAVAMVAFSRVAFLNPVLGIFVGPLEQEFGWSRTEIAGALSVGTLVGGVSAPFIGPLVDRWGGRRFMVGAGLTLGVLLLLLAATQALWQFYLLFGAGRAVVTGILDIAILVTLSNWFIRRRGRAMGLVMVGTSGGIALMPLVVLLFLSIADWRAGFAALGILILLVAVAPPYLLVRRRPEDLGLAPDGDRPARSPGASAFSASLGGELRERLGVRIALPLVMLATTLGLGLLIAVENVWMAYLFAVLHGLAFGAQLPLNQIVFADHFGRWSIGAIRGISAPCDWGSTRPVR